MFPGDKLVGEVSRLVVAEACIQALDIEFTNGKIYEINSIEVIFQLESLWPGLDILPYIFCSSLLIPSVSFMCIKSFMVCSLCDNPYSGGYSHAT